MQKAIKLILLLLGSAFLFILMTSFGGIKMAIFTFIAALLHEAGHVFILLLLRKEFSIPNLVTSGFRIKTISNLSYLEEMITAAFGPLTNIFLFAFAFPHSEDFAVINLATAISNLLPLQGYDGYKILDDIFSLLLGPQRSAVIMEHASLIASGTAVLLSLLFILVFNGGYWIFSIFFIILMRQIIFFQKQAKNEHS